jgi:undecaprenyl-diphosphatase
MQDVEFFILNWIQANCRGELLDALMPVVTAVCDHGEIWILLAVALLLYPKTRRTGMVVAAALILDVICCNAILKPLIGRIRPCDVNTAVSLLIPHPTDASFPSGHAASSFAAVAALYACRSKWWRPAFVMALLLSFSRLYLYVHWPSDVLAGAVLGILLGFLAWRLTAYLERRFGHALGSFLKRPQ